MGGPTRVTVYIALGSNIAPRLKFLRYGLKRLVESGVRLLRISSVYRSSPVGYAAQPDFLNAVVCGKTSLEAAELLMTCKAIEKETGRTVGKRFGPRPLDLDLLLYENRSFDTPRLTIPHPRMEKRAFVLFPLLEISPKLTNHRGVRYDLLLSKLDKGQKIQRYRRNWTGKK